jgi:hypothetical protein
MSKIRVGVVAAALVSVASFAQAAPITLDLVAAGSTLIGPQSNSAPCIIAGTHCQNPAGFGYTNFVQSGNDPDYNEYSPMYTLSDFPFGAFAVAIDVNTTKDAGETLQLFEVRVDGVLTHLYTGPGLIGDPVANNGNGYGDWTLEDIDLTNYAPGAQVQFHAVFDGASGGAESFVIGEREGPPCSPTDPNCNPCEIDCPCTGEDCNPDVPEPASVALLGAGLASVVAIRRRKRS